MKAFVVILSIAFSSAAFAGSCNGTQQTKEHIQARILGLFATAQQVYPFSYMGETKSGVDVYAGNIIESNEMKTKVVLCAKPDGSVSCYCQAQ